MNTGGNTYGGRASMHPRVVAIFRRWGFVGRHVDPPRRHALRVDGRPAPVTAAKVLTLRLVETEGWHAWVTGSGSASSLGGRDCRSAPFASTAIGAYCPRSTSTRRTAYRSYAERQVDDAVLIRDLRRLGIGLADVAAFLAATPDDRRAIVEEHLRGLERQLESARAVAHALDVPTSRQETAMTAMIVTADELGRALDQVLPAAGSDAERPVLMCVLVEAKDGSLRLVATDSYRLVIRDLVGREPDEAFQALLPAATFRRWRTALTGDTAVRVGLDDADLVITGTGVALRGQAVPATFPAYELFLARDAAAGHVVVARDGLLGVLERFASGGGAVLLRAGADELVVLRDDVSEVLPIRYAGPELHVAVDPAYAADAVPAALGPEVVIEIADPLRPVVFRSADDGTYTTMLMPVRLA